MYFEKYLKQLTGKLWKKGKTESYKDRLVHKN